jgi:hypothetical protein
VRGWTARLVAMVVVAAVVVAGCSGDDADTASDTADAESAMQDMGDEAVEEEVADDGGEAAAGGGATVARRGADDVVTFGEGEVVGRQLARTATITLEVDDVEDAARAVSAAAGRAGGYVESAEVEGGDFGYARITVRVPAAALDGTLLELADVGLRVVSSGIATEDLTDQLVDLGARIDNLERLEAELQELLATIEDADADADELLTVYERISSVRGDIERLEAQRAAAADRVALATIRVELVAAAIAPEEVEPTPETTLARAWDATRDAFGAIGDALVWFFVTILPVALVVLVVPGLVLWLVVRAAWRRRADGSSTSGPPRPTSAVPPDPGGEDGVAPAGGSTAGRTDGEG